MQDIKALTDKPVKYVIDSHFHYDHLFGNQIFGSDVQIIGHDHTALRLKANTLGAVHVPHQRPADSCPRRRAQAAHRTGSRSSRKTALERQMQNSLAYLEQVKETKQTPPNITFDNTMTITRGGREFRLMYLGRGHTDTDVVTYLPKERIVATGDLMSR